jgi:undecaprenyl-diphosphatase
MLRLNFPFSWLYPQWPLRQDTKRFPILKKRDFFTSDQLTTLFIGNAVAFVVALLAIKFFIGFVKERGFKIFGIYRIILGCVVLLLIYLNVIG